MSKAVADNNYCSADLAARAAAAEACDGSWEARFRQLFSSGILTMRLPPGKEIALPVASCAQPEDLLAAVSSFVHQLTPALLSGCMVGVDLSQVGTDYFDEWLAEFTSAIGGLWCAEQRPQGVLTLSLCIDHPKLLRFLQLRGCRELGCPRVAVRFDTSVRYSKRAWQMLIELSHTDERVILLPVMAVRPLSGLHASERGQCVMPVGLFEAPASSAWIMLELNAARLAPPPLLRQQLATCLRFADNLIDVQDWPQPRLRMDALLNRRIALHLVGIGQLVADAGLDPASFSTLQQVQRWLVFVRKCFVRESRLLARNRGPFPAFGADELVASLAPRYGVADANRLVRNRSLRHRHLLALSPFAVFPDSPDVAADEHALSLLPAISCADILTMYGKDMRRRMRLGSWSRLLQMTGALAASGSGYA